jgi:hypothetical protein
MVTTDPVGYAELNTALERELERFMSRRRRSN